MIPVIVMGAGGHAGVLIDTLEVLAREIIGLTDSNSARHGTRLLGYEVIGTDDVIERWDVGSIRLVNGIGSIGSAAVRSAIYVAYTARGYAFETVVHPTAIVSRHAEIGPGVQVLAGAIVQAGARIGANTIVNSGAIVEHDCTIGPHCHVAPGAVLSGGVTIGEAAHIGTGASVKQDVLIGAAIIVASGAAVVRNVADRHTVRGVPAR